MKKIDASNFNRLGISSLVFKYPVHSETTRRYFYPDVDSDFKKYMIIRKDDNEIRLSSELMFLHENKNAILNRVPADLLDGTWWVLF